jgi:hypothetical protein
MKYEPLNSELTEVGPNNPGILIVPDSEFESKINLLFVLLNTREGERVLDKGFGLTWDSALFEQYNVNDIEATEVYISTMVMEKIDKYLPDFKLSDIEIVVDGDYGSRSGSMIIRMHWVYRDKWQFESFSVVELNNKFGSLLSNVSLYENTGQGESIVTKRIMVNIINTIKADLMSESLKGNQ